MMYGPSFLTRLKINNSRRYWISILDFFVLLAFLPIRFFALFNYAKQEAIEGADYLWGNNSPFVQAIAPRGLFIFVLVFAAILSGMQGFSYLYNRQKVDFYHSQPITHRTRFWSIYVNGALYFIVPYLLNMLLCVLIAGYFGSLNLQVLGAMAVSSFFQILAFLAFYNTSILATVLCGNYIIGLLGTAAIFGVEWGYRALIFRYCKTFLFTFSADNKNEIMNPVLSVGTVYLQAVRKFAVEAQFSAGCLWQTMSGKVFYMVFLGLIALTMAYLVYIFRKEESYDTGLAFPFLRPLILIVALTLIGLLVGWFVADISHDHTGLTISGILIGLIFVYAIMQMVYKYTPKDAMFNLWQLLVSVAFSLVVYLGFKADAMGYDHFIPKENKLDSVSVVVDAQLSDTMLDLKQYEGNIFITDYDLISQLVAGDYYHRLSSGEEMTDELGDCNTMFVMYRYKNGKRSYRNLYLNFELFPEIIDNLLSNDEYKRGTLPIMKGVYNNNDNITVAFESQLSFWHEFPKEQGQLLLMALQDNINDYNYRMVSQEPQLGSIRILEYNEKLGYQEIIDSYPIYKSYTQTCHLLSSFGDISINQEDFLDNISRVEVEYIPTDDSEVGIEGTKKVILTRKFQIREFLSLCEDTSNGLSWKSTNRYYPDIYVGVYLNNGGYMNYSVLSDLEIPKDIQSKLRMKLD